MEPSFPEVIDSSMLSNFAGCPRLGYYAHIRNIVPAGVNPHLNAGGAYAKALQVFRVEYYQHGKNFESARAAGFLALTREYGAFDPNEPEKNKSWINVVFAYIFYLVYFNPREDAIKPIINPNASAAVEFSFAVPLPLNHPETGNPLIFGGRADMIAEYNGMTLLLDDKTTSQMGPKWADQWAMRGQFTGYAWASREYGMNAAGMIVRGVSIQSTQNKYLQHIEFTPEWRINRWYDGMISQVEYMRQAYFHLVAGRGTKAYPTFGEFNGRCSHYSGCSYKTLCTSNDPETWIPAQFIDHKWSPLRSNDA
jgi:hypothetical protein